MIISLNEYLDIPVYMQIRNQIVQGISQGKLAPGEKLPTVRGLAEEIGINSMTVNKAYQLLKQEGYILSDKRNGARIRENFDEKKELDFQSREALKQLICEARVRGMSKEAFIKECAALYEEDNV